MKKSYVNAFHLIKPIDKGENPNLFNRIFGPSPVITHKKWPKTNGLYCHHIITFDASGFEFPGSEDIGAISIFRSQILPDDFEKEAFHLVGVKKSELAIPNPSFPEEYFSDLKGNFKEDFFSKGLPFKIELQSNIPKEIVEAGLSCEDDFYEIPYEYEEINDYDSSFIGGFPIWIQANATPVQKNGRSAHFLLQLTGFDDWFNKSIMHGYDLYVFLTDDGELLYEAQS